MKHYIYLPVVTILTSCAVANTGAKDSGKVSPSARIAQPVQVPVPSQAFRAGKSGVKPYSAVITKNLITEKGLFTVHSTKEKDSVFFEINNQLLGRDILVVNKIRKIGGADMDVYPGEILDNTTIILNKEPNDVISMRLALYVNYADPADAISKAVANSSVNPIIATFPIKAYGKDSSSFVIDVSKYLRDPKSIVNTGNANATLKRSIDVTYMKDHDISSLQVFPENIEIGITKNGFSKGTNIILETNASFIALPKEPMKLRLVDKRVGYLFNSLTEFSDAQQRVENIEFISRWRMEPKKDDLQKYLAGNLVEPAKPIVFYIDPATPKQWRKYMIAGVNDWQAAFEKAGFKNAIMAKEWPENDASLNKEDIRYSFINYHASTAATASGPSIKDPRSGEIVQANVNWYHNYNEKLRQLYILQAGVNDASVQSPQVSDAVMGEIIRHAVSHEIGHTLGLSNNFGSSSSVPVDSLRNMAYLRKNGHTPSVMDNSRFNYVAQPEDKIPADLLLSGVGEYDKWAIEFGYRILAGNKTAKEERLELLNLVSKRLAANERLRFGDGELSKADPRNQEDDMGDDAAKASSLGVKNLKRAMGHLRKWSSSETDQRQELKNIYTLACDQFTNYVLHVVKNIAAVNYTIRTSGDERPSYSVVPKAKQLAALQFLNDELFTTPKWLEEAKLIDLINLPLDQSPAEVLQMKTINSLLDPKRLNYIFVLERRFGAGNTISITDFFSMLHKGIWNDLNSGNVTIDSYHRAMQKVYIGALYKIVMENNPIIAESEASSIANGEIRELDAKIKSAKTRTTDATTLSHLTTLESKISLFLK